MDREGIVKRHAELLTAHDLESIRIFMSPLKQTKDGGYIVYEQFYVAKDEAKDLAFLLINMF